MIPNNDKLKQTLDKSTKYINDNFKSEVSDIDHASFQTVDINEYKDLFEELSKTERLVDEINYGGRKMAVFELKKPIKSNNYELKRIEIEQPKPVSEIEESSWESVSFKVNDLNALIEKNKSTDHELKKIRQVGDDKYGYIMMDEFRIQLRNNFFCVDKNGSQSEGEDYKSLYEEEKNKRLMALADIENERKRLQRQKEEFVRLANAAMMNDLFEVVDDLNRGLNSDIDKDSLKMIYNKILGILNNYDVITLDVKEGDKFDPSIMEAVTTAPGGDKMKDKVLHVDQIGFKHKQENKTLKLARVIVGK